MNAKAVFFAVLVVWSISVLSIPAQSDPEKEVRRLERAWLDAYEQRDVKAMDEIVADGFVITFPNGSKQTKPQLIEMIKRPRREGEFVKHHTEEVKAKVNGDTVVLTGRVISEYGVNGQVRSKDESLYTDTYAKRNGKWQVVESHLAEPKPKN